MESFAHVVAIGATSAPGDYDPDEYSNAAAEAFQNTQDIGGCSLYNRPRAASSVDS